jgi:hypothetical protein
MRRPYRRRMHSRQCQRTDVWHDLTGYRQLKDYLRFFSRAGNGREGWVRILRVGRYITVTCLLVGTVCMRHTYGSFF